jgi:colicin import membrane protein
VADKYRRPVSDEFPTGLELPQLATGRFHVSGISALMREQEKLRHMATHFAPMFDPNGQGKVFMPYLKPGGYITELLRLTQMTDSKFAVDEQKAMQIDQAQQQQQDAEIQATQQKLAAEAHQAEQEAQRKAAEATKFLAEAEAAKAKAGTLDAQAELHISKAELAEAQAISTGMKTPEEINLAQANARAAHAQAAATLEQAGQAAMANQQPPEQPEQPEQPGPAEMAQAESHLANAEQTRAMIPHQIDTEKANAEKIRAEAEAAGQPPAPPAKGGGGQ